MSYEDKPEHTTAEAPPGSPETNGSGSSDEAPPPLCPEAVKHLELATMHIWNAQAACRRQGLKTSLRLLEAARAVAHHVKDMLE